MIPTPQTTKYCGQRWVDIHLMRMPSTGYRFDVDPSSLVYWMKCLHSWCRFKIDRISFRLKLSGFGAKNDEKSSISEKLIDGFSWKVVYMLSEYEMRLSPKYGVNRPSGLGGVCWHTLSAKSLEYMPFDLSKITISNKRIIFIIRCNLI